MRTDRGGREGFGDLGEKGERLDFVVGDAGALQSVGFDVGCEGAFIFADVVIGLPEGEADIDGVFRRQSRQALRQALENFELRIGARHPLEPRQMVVGAGAARRDSNHRLQSLPRRVENTEFAEQYSLVLHGLDIGGAQRQRLVVARERIEGPFKLLERIAAVVEGFGVSWPERDRSLVIAERLGEPFQLPQRIATIVDRFDEVWVESQRCLIAHDRLQRLAQRQKATPRLLSAAR